MLYMIYKKKIAYVLKDNLNKVNFVVVYVVVINE